MRTREQIRNDKNQHKISNGMTTQTLKNWQKVKLGDLAQDVRQLYTPTKDEKLPYVGLEHIEQQTLHLSGIGRSNETESTKKIFKSGDILFGTLRPYFRKVTMPKFNGVCSTDIAVIRPTKNSDGNFLKYFIANQDFIDHASNISSGTRMPRANWKVLKDQVWLFPELTEQKEIGDALVAYDELIENNTKRIKILEQMAQAIYTERFVKNSKFKNKNVKLSEIVRPQYGYTESASEDAVGPKYLRGTDINKNTFIDWSAVPYCKIDDEDKKKYQLRKGDVVIIRMADPGKLGIVEQDVNAVFASYLIRLEITDKRIAPYYLFYFLNSDKYQNYIQGASGGTTRKSASAGVVTGTEIPIPPMELVDKFEKDIALLRTELNYLLMQNSNLRQTRDLLIPKLVTGEIRV